jgi:hypothetical protein
MGRSYWFECPRCGYRAKVSGGADRGFNFLVQTIACLDCKQLHDAVIRARMPVEPQARKFSSTIRRVKPSGPERVAPCNVDRISSSAKCPPSFESVLSRLAYAGVKRLRWVQFKLQCPVSPRHRIESWNEPNKCPRCGIYLEKSGLPYRIWE